MLALLPQLTRGLTIAGAVFLAIYGIRALGRMMRSATMVPGSENEISIGRALATTAAFTFLNPHVYLDTVLLMGVAGSSQPVAGRPVFVLGAAAASYGWFALLGFGARVAAPLFASARAWRAVDGLVGFTMLAIATGLACRGLGPQP